MMNPMPMPNGPAEIPGGMMKAERPAAHSERGGSAKQGDSFASTLKAVHGQNRTSGESSKAGADNTRNKQETLEKESELPPTDGQEAAAEENQVEAIVTREMRCEMAKFDSPVPAAGSDLAGELESPPGENPAEGEVEKAAPQPDGQFKKLEQASQAAFTAVSKKTASEEAVASKPNPQGMTAAPTNPTESVATVPDNGSKAADGLLKPAAAVLQTTPDRPAVKNADGPPAPITGAGEDGSGRAEGPALAGEGDLGENDTPDAARLAKLIPNRDTANVREDSQSSNPRPMRTETSEMTSGRFPSGEGHSEQEKSSGGAGRETPLPAMNDVPNNAAPRPGLTDTPLSFSAAAAGRTETPTPGTGSAAAMTTTADHFHQDNFHHLVERAVFAMRGEQSEARIALKPDQLGHIQMRIVTENHLVSIKILTESPVARDLIDAHAHQLKSELQQQGLTVENIEVSVSDDQRDAYRGARQRESFLRQMASHGQRGAQEEDSHPLRRGLGQQRPGRRREAGIDYFA